LRCVAEEGREVIAALGAFAAAVAGADGLFGNFNILLRSLQQFSINLNILFRIHHLRQSPQHLNPPHRATPHHTDTIIRTIVKRMLLTTQIQLIPSIPVVFLTADEMFVEGGFVFLHANWLDFHSTETVTSLFHGKSCQFKLLGRLVLLFKNDLLIYVHE
jgi:hypothetical protein